MYFRALFTLQLVQVRYEKYCINQKKVIAIMYFSYAEGNLASNHQRASQSKPER